MMKDKEENRELKPGLCRHYKGEFCEVIGTAHHSETLEDFAVYRHLSRSDEFGQNALWVRPKAMFLEDVKLAGKIMPRFDSNLDDETKWRQSFCEGKEVVLATSSEDAKPNANIIISLGFAEKDRLLAADCQMSTTLSNLKANPKVCLVAGYYRLKARAEIFSSGKYFEMCSKKSKGYKVRNAILFSVEEVFDLNNIKKVYP